MLTSILHNKQTLTTTFSLRKLFLLILMVAGCWYIGFQISASMQGKDTVSNIHTVSPPTPLPDFHLQDQYGQVFELSRLKGQWSILFFGFTQCPDICPATLQQLKVLNSAMAQQTIARVAPQTVFISVDPKRDTAQLGEYVSYFSKQFVGVSGDMSEVGKLENGVGAWHQYQSTSLGDYNVAHSGELFLINPRGELQARLQPPLDIPTIAQELLLLMSGQV